MVAVKGKEFIHTLCEGLFSLSLLGAGVSEA